MSKWRTESGLIVAKLRLGNSEVLADSVGFRAVTADQPFLGVEHGPRALMVAGQLFPVKRRCCNLSDLQETS